MTEFTHQHVPPGTLRAYREGRIDAAETLAVSDALAACVECREALSALPPAPAYEEIADAADRGQESAFADEPVASAELADLLAFRREMAGRGDQVFEPVPVSGQDKVDGKTVPLPLTFWRRKFFAAPAAAAALLLLAGGWWMLDSFRDGGKRSLLTDGQGHHVAVAALPAGLRETVQNTLRDGRLPTSPTLAGLRPASGTLAGPTDAATFRVISPVGVVVRDLQPTLRWTASEGATDYEIVLMREEGEDPAYGRVPRSIEPGWMPPRPLVPGAIYSWQVTALRGEEALDRAPKPPSPEARFRVLGEAERTELAQVEARYGQYPLVMAAAYARAGLIIEEAAALDRLAREHPRSPLAQQLRAELLAQPLSR